MPATLRGIFHNLKESEYTISNSEVVFFFSSKVYMNKFLEGYQKNRSTFTRGFAKITEKEPPYNMDMFADLHYYFKLETRGFYAWIKGVESDWRDVHQYALRRMTVPNTLDWRKIQKPKLEERLRTMGAISKSSGKMAK